jgi:F0F1-type ATP synthase assembly protein I
MIAFSGVFLVTILIFVYIGYKIDNYLGTTPIFIFIGLAYSLYGSFKLLMIKKDEADE